MLEYGDVIWDSCSLENKRNIENIQLDAARIFTGATNYVALKSSMMTLA